MKQTYEITAPTTHKIVLIKPKNVDPTQWTKEQFYELLQEMDISKLTINSYKYSMGLFFDFLDNHLGGMHVTDVTRTEYIKFKNHIKKQKYSVYTKNAHLLGVRMMYNALERYKINNPIKGVKSFNTTANREYSKQGITVKQWREVLDKIETYFFSGKKHHMIMFLLFTTGVRQMSLRELKWKDFCYKVGIGLEMIVRLKGSGIRTGNIPLNDEACILLENYRLAYRKLYCKLDKNEYTEIDQEWYVFGNKTKMLGDRAMRKLTTQYLREAGIHKTGRVTTHSLRHGFAQHIVNKHGITTAQVLLCHANLNATRIYAGQAENVKVIREARKTLNNITIQPKEVEAEEQAVEVISDNALDFAFNLNDF